MAEPETFKAIMRMFNYGLFVATCAGHGTPRAATVSWATQVSFEPKQVAVALRKGTSICDAVQTERRFGLHVVGEHQPELARAFFKRPARADRRRSRGTATGCSRAACRSCMRRSPGWSARSWSSAARRATMPSSSATVVDGDIQIPGIRSLALRDTVWHYGG